MDKIVPFALMCLLTSAVLVACRPSQTARNAQATEIAAEIYAAQTATASVEQSTLPDQGPYDEFLPMKPGTEWVYQVELESDVKAVLYQEETWPGDISQNIWGRLTRWRFVDTVSPAETYVLTIRVKRSKHQGESTCIDPDL